MHTLFANTGVQIVCVPLVAGRRFSSAQIGYGWQYCKCRDVGSEEDDEPKTVDFPYIQWQIVQSHVSKLYLAIDTSLGDPEIGFFCDPTSLAGDFLLHVENLIDLTGQPLAGVPPVDVTIRAATATAGEAKPVHLVVDFGNSRTGALLVEMSGEVTQAAEMLPFELVNRYTLDTFDEHGEGQSRPAGRWFSSKTRWCNAPYQLPRETGKVEYYRDTVKGVFGKKQVTREREVTVRPQLFDDYSMIRMGREADDVTQIMHAKGDFRTGVSSPKRYLWADDEAWLEGAFWYMADPHDRLASGTFSAKLQGTLLKYLHEDDRDFLLEKADPPEEMFASEVPVKPRHAPRALMVTAIYEMLCQAYTYVNSQVYRSHTTDPARSREIRSLTMTYPSGMFQPERERFQKQCAKAINIFNRTIGKHQSNPPTLTLSIDEASAVHLTYIWSELRMLGQDPRLWFSTISRDFDAPKATVPAELDEAEEGGEEIGAVAAGRRRSRVRIRRPGQGGGGGGGEEETDNRGREMRIACIDIGGGTTDMMIAKYTFEPGIDDSIHGQVLHQDGISVAGDQLVKRLLERVIVPKFADAIGLEDEDTLLLFGPEVPKNRGFSSNRIDWINRLLVPLAEQYLEHAVLGVTDEEITHTDPEVIDPAVLESFEQICNKLRGAGYYNVQQELGLSYHKDEFDDVVHEVFDDLLFDYCSRITDHRADVILLAGQPSKLGYIQNLVDMYTPLPSSRIIPMYHHYAGNWYPYQDTKGHSPGLIVDPKSAVVVGASIEFMARNGMLPQFKFSMRGKESENTYHWGVMTESTSTIREERVLFWPVEEGDNKDEAIEFDTSSQRVIIGRKMSGDEAAQTQPIYFLKTDTAGRIGQINLKVRIRRNRATDKVEEHLEIESVTGEVAGQPAVLGENVQFGWRTIADERYYLDTGGLDNIELDGR